MLECICPLHINFEPKINIARGLTTPNTPVACWDFTNQDFDVIFRNTQRLKVVDDGLIEIALCVE